MYSGQIKVHGIEISCSTSLGIFNTLCGLALFHVMQFTQHRTNTCQPNRGIFDKICILLVYFHT